MTLISILNDPVYAFQKQRFLSSSHSGIGYNGSKLKAFVLYAKYCVGMTVVLIRAEKKFKLFLSHIYLHIKPRFHLVYTHCESQ